MSDPTIPAGLDPYVIGIMCNGDCGRSDCPKCTPALSTPTTPDEGEEARAREVLAETAGFPKRYAAHCRDTDTVRLGTAIRAMLAFRPSEGEGLRKALEPFATYFDRVLEDRDEFPDDARVIDNKAGRKLTYGDFRRARAALKGER